RSAGVAVVDHRRQRGRLARARGADDQHQPARGHDDLLEHLRQLQLLDRGDGAADRADHHADLAALLEHVDAEAPRVLQRQRHVQLQVALELRHLALVHQRVRDLLDHALGQAGVAERVELALDLDVDGCAGRQEHVRRVLFRHQLQEIADVHERTPTARDGIVAIPPDADDNGRGSPGARPPNGHKLRTNQIGPAGPCVRNRAGAHGLREPAAADGGTGDRAAGRGPRRRRRRRPVRGRRHLPGPARAGTGAGGDGPGPRGRGALAGRPGRGGRRPGARLQPQGRGRYRTGAASRRDQPAQVPPRDGGRTMKYLSIGLAALLLAAPLAQAAENPELVRLSQRLQALDADPATAQVAAYERLQARQALQALEQARSSARPAALKVAQARVETAEVAAQTAVIEREIDRLDRERSELLVEASRRDAARARREAERLRIQAQIQAEEAARLREQADAATTAQAEAEGALDSVASGQAARLRAARQRAAELARQ